MAKEQHFKIQIPYVPYPLQKEIIDYVQGKYLNPEGRPYHFFIAVLGRQSGKSWMDRYLVIDHAVNRGEGVMWVAPTRETARSHWNKIKDDIEKSGLPVKHFSEQSKEIRFYGGGFFRVRSAIEPDNLRGEGLNLIILDEAAFYRNGPYVWKNVIQPMVIATGGKVLITTTPNGRNYVYDLFNLGLPERNNPIYRSWHMPSAMSPYVKDYMLKEIKESIPSLEYAQEYEAQFLAGGGSIFNRADEASVVPFQHEPTRQQLEEGYFVAGGDFGFDGDFSTFTSIYVPYNEDLPPLQVYGESWTTTSPIENMQKMKENIERWQPRTLHMERNGIGGPLFKLFKDVLNGEDLPVLNETYRTGKGEDVVSDARAILLGQTKIIALTMDNALKRGLVETAAAKVEYGGLLLVDAASKYGAKQLSEISTFERKHTQSGNDITYGAEEGYNDDHVSGLYLAVKGLPRRRRIVHQQETVETPQQASQGLFRGAGKSLKRG